MIEQNKATGFMKVENYSLGEFLKDCQECIQKGYLFDFETNDNYPTAFGTLYVAVMTPKDKQKKNTQDINTNDAIVDETILFPEITESVFEDATGVVEKETVIKSDGRKKKIGI